MQRGVMGSDAELMIGLSATGSRVLMRVLKRNLGMDYYKERPGADYQSKRLPVPYSAVTCDLNGSPAKDTLREENFQLYISIFTTSDLK